MYEIHPNLLWIGHAFDVREPQGIFDNGISAVVDVAYEEPCAQLPRKLVYCRFPLNDGGENHPPTVVRTLETVVGLLRSNTKTLIACSAGMSRSPTIAAYSLAMYLDSTPADMIDMIGEIKSLELNSPFWLDVMEAYTELNPEWMDRFDG